MNGALVILWAQDETTKEPKPLERADDGGLRVSGAENFIWKDASEQALNLVNQTVPIAWTDLDLTAYTSPSAKWAYVLLRMWLNAIIIPSYGDFAIRKNGTTPTVWPHLMVSSYNGDIAGAQIYACTWIGMDDNQVVEYRLRETGTIDVSLFLDVLAYMEG